MFRSVHDHPDGRNRTDAVADGGAQGRGGLHVHRDGSGAVQRGPLRTAHHMVGAHDRADVHGAAGAARERP